jgi:hypothetical protein
VLLLMHRVLDGVDPAFVIYPGTSAHSLGELISLNIGWQADFRVLLDGDEDGLKAGAKYQEKFALPGGVIHTLPKANKTIERMFTAADRALIYRLAFGKAATGKVSKNEFAGAVSTLTFVDVDLDALRKGLGPATVARFRKLFSDFWDRGGDG